MGGGVRIKVSEIPSGQTSFEISLMHGRRDANLEEKEGASGPEGLETRSCL